MPLCDQTHPLFSRFDSVTFNQKCFLETFDFGLKYTAIVNWSWSREGSYIYFTYLFASQWAQTLATTFNSWVKMTKIITNAATSLIVLLVGLQRFDFWLLFFVPVLSLVCAIWWTFMFFYILPSQMQMSAQESPVWTLTFAKIWLVDITATVSGDGLDKTVTSVSISSSKSLLNFCLSTGVTSFPGYLQTPPLTSLDTPHRCSMW